MGYACPVCATPQRDAEHLANHLAFTAMLHDDDHREWLDDHVPGWASLGPDDLGPRVVDHAPEATYEAVFDDTTRERGRPFDGGVDPASRADAADAVDTAGAAGAAGAALDGEAAEALAAARAMTREMLGAAGGDDPSEEDPSAGADDSAGADERDDGEPEEKA